MAGKRRKRSAARRRGRGPRRRSWLLLFLALGIAAATLWVGLDRGWSWGRTARPALGELLGPVPFSEAPRLEAAAEDSPAVQAPAVQAPPGDPGPVGLVAIVIDDLGRSLDEIRALVQLDVPLSYAVLPYETRTAEVTEALDRDHQEILVHLPMAPASDKNPGPGALSAGMKPAELSMATQRALDRIPPAAGVNNHMGSELTVDRRAMATVLRVVASREMFFLDSRTSPATLGYRLARELGMPAAERHVFLDTDSAPEAVRDQFLLLLELAREQGGAIAIGHPYPATVAVLAREIPSALEAGFTFVPVSFLLDRSASPAF